MNSPCLTYPLHKESVPILKEICTRLISVRRLVAGFLLCIDDEIKKKREIEKIENPLPASVDSWNRGY